MEADKKDTTVVVAGLLSCRRVDEEVDKVADASCIGGSAQHGCRQTPS
jgi:hypothetical protein